MGDIFCDDTSNYELDTKKHFMWIKDFNPLTSSLFGKHHCCHFIHKDNEVRKAQSEEHTRWVAEKKKIPRLCGSGAG